MGYYGHKVGYDAALVFDAAHAALPLGGKLLVAIQERGQKPVAQHGRDVHVALLGAAGDGILHDPWQRDAKHRVLG